MTQITVRNVPAELALRLKKLSRSRGQSLNAMVLEILESAVGIDKRRKRLERYATWSAEDLRQFEDALKTQRTVDEALWR